MRHPIIGTIFALVLFAIVGPKVVFAQTSKEVPMLHWLGHASFRIDTKDGKVIYTDPWEVKSTAKADLILITHEHYDHCSPDDVKKLSKPGTVVVATPDCGAKLGVPIQAVRPGQSGTYAGFKVEAVPAYNTNKEFHQKSKNWVGYIITVDGKRIYQAGDTDVIPEMREVTCDVALLPVGGTYTMNGTEAAQSTTMIKAKEWIPMHWGKIVGSQADADAFKAAVKTPAGGGSASGGGTVTILPRE